jgi:uncharacterized Zn finger protein
VTGVQLLLDEHVGRVFERMLRERGYDVEQAKDRFGEHTSDADLVSWCGSTIDVSTSLKRIEREYEQQAEAETDGDGQTGLEVRSHSPKSSR